MKVDYLIIGQGLAGTLLTHFALQKGKTVLVLNEVEKATISKAIRGVKFLQNRATLTEYSEGIIKDVYNLLNKNPDYKFEISGHTDSVGNDADNLALSKARAKTCKDLLIKMNK